MNHGRSFRDYSENADFGQVAAVLTGPETSPILDDADRAILRLAGKIALSPERIAEADISALRAAGLSEENIVDAIACACYRVFANRLNFAMGDVDRDPDGPPELLRAIAEIKNRGAG